MKRNSLIRRKVGDPRFEFILGDVRDKSSLYSLNGVDHVFQARFKASAEL